MVCACHHSHPVTISRLLLSPSRGQPWLRFIENWSIIQTASLKRIFFLSYRVSLSRVLPGHGSRLMALSIVHPLHSWFVKLIAFVADVSNKLFLSVIAAQMEWPVIRNESVRIIHVRNSELWSSIRISIGILRIKVILIKSRVLSWRVNKVFIFLFLHVMDQLESIIDVDIVFHRYWVELLENRAHVINLTQSYQEWNVVIKTCILLVVVPRQNG